eukprot:18514-Heterococcus_DN1.PRE.2
MARCYAVQQLVSVSRSSSTSDGIVSSGVPHHIAYALVIVVKSGKSLLLTLVAHCCSTVQAYAYCTSHHLLYKTIRM